VPFTLSGTTTVNAIPYLAELTDSYVSTMAGME
jgi:hypothetical protein